MILPGRFTIYQFHNTENSARWPDDLFILSHDA